MGHTSDCSNNERKKLKLRISEKYYFSSRAVKWSNPYIIKNVVGED